MLAQMYGAVRQGSRRSFLSDGQQPVDINLGGDTIVSQCLPYATELTRLGCRWSLQMIDTSAVTPGSGYPTTTSQLTLYNGEPAGGKSYVIDTTWASFITSIAQASSLVLLAQISNAGVAAPTQDTTQNIMSTSGKTAYQGNAVRCVAPNTAFAVANKWTVIGNSDANPSAAIGTALYAELFGRFIIPPGAAYCTNFVASTNAGTAIFGIDWYEVQLDLG